MESAINNDRISISVTAWNEEGLAAAVRLQLHAVEDKSHPVLETESLTIGADGGATEFGARSLAKLVAEYRLEDSNPRLFSVRVRISAATPESRWKGVCEIVTSLGSLARRFSVRVRANGEGRWSRRFSAYRRPEGIDVVAHWPSDRRHGLSLLRQSDEVLPGNAALLAWSRTVPPTLRAGRCDVFFATNRVLLEERRRAGALFGGELGDQVRYGMCTVWLPERPKIGTLGYNWLARWFRSEGGDARIERCEIMKEMLFWARLEGRLAATRKEERHAAVFIHGFNVDFEEAAIRAAQLAIDLRIRDIAFFSWGSRGKAPAYIKDESAIDDSEHDIGEFLVAFAQRLKPAAVHVFAHSMGNRALARSIERVVQNSQLASGIRFTNLILGAPDTSVRLFRRLYSDHHRCAARTTMYVSDRDFPLLLSELLHGHERVGNTLRPLIIDGVDTVVARHVAGLGSHSYLFESRAVLEDIQRIIHLDASPKTRMLDASDDGTYWILPP